MGKEGRGALEPPLDQRDLTEKSDIERQRHTAVASTGQTLRGGHEKSIAGTRCQFGIKANLENLPHVFLLKISIRQDPKESSRLSPKIQNIGHFSLVSLSPHTRLRPGTERIRQGEGRWSRPSKGAVERSDLTKKFEVRKSHAEAETKKARCQSLSSQIRTSLYKFFLRRWFISRQNATKAE